ncbi:MAG: HlyD family efflux transporter periplasmic adaptor subunit [Bacteroidales bacterium]|nr:HlyD family efflux transporter periplasmic adaptor subunit [Bacteroidales bacterium]MCF8455234.1 HlyD family efflux transporter periplasmic adaptor subunit [Bacteroidales bacterium]
MNTRIFLIAIIALIATFCNSDNNQSVAYGNFESDELYVSAKGNGELLGFQIEKGQELVAGQIVGYIDTTTLNLQVDQLQAKQSAIPIALEELNSQLKLLNLKKENLQINFNRISELLKKEAATQQQFDNMKTELEVAEQQIAQISVKRKSILHESKVLDKQIDLIRHQISESKIINPIKGVVLDKFIEEHELCGMGKPIYKIANLDQINLKAYVSARQLAGITIGQQVKVAIDGPDEGLIFYDGTISWISPEAEFTPKVIQTPEERLNLVYAIKVKVENDGKIKIGMPGEVHFN